MAAPVAPVPPALCRHLHSIYGAWLSKQHVLLQWKPSPTRKRSTLIRSSHMNLLQLLWNLLVSLGRSHWLLWRSWGGNWDTRSEKRKQLHTSSNSYPWLSSGAVQFPFWKAWVVSVVLELLLLLCYIICFACKGAKKLNSVEFLKSCTLQYFKLMQGFGWETT